MSDDLVISGDEFHARDLEQPAVIRNPFPYYDMLRDKPLQFGVRGYPPGTVEGMDEPIPAWAVLKYKDLCTSRQIIRFFFTRSYARGIRRTHFDAGKP